MMKRVIILTTALCCLLLPVLARAGQPLEAVQSRVNQVLQVLKDPALQGKDKETEKRDKLESIASNMFDFETLSRFTLGRNWKQLNDAQQREFVKLYRKLLQNAYLDKVMAYTDEKIVFSKETMLTESKAEVFSEVLTSKSTIPINYRVRQTGSTWKVYDVIIEGVSLVKNYRSQFNSILSKNSPEQMLKDLRQKVS